MPPEPSDQPDPPIPPDLTRLLQQWAYRPDEVLVRVVRGEDGRERVQLGVDLGLLQMEIDGRPDGQQPEGCTTWLDYYERQQAEHDQSHPDSTPFRLGEEDCLRLWQEGVQFYHRYLSFWYLGRHNLCARDTQRNLRLFAFVRAFAPNEQHKFQFDQWRPYVTMMHARAVATPLVEQGRLDEGLRAIESGIDGIHEFLDDYDHAHRADECAELRSLEAWREEVRAKRRQSEAARPLTPLESLRRRLAEAVAAEQFEEAARLRDEIRQMEGDLGI